VAGSIQFPNVLPVALIELGGIILLLAVVVGVVYNIWKWKEPLGLSSVSGAKSDYLKDLPRACLTIVLAEVVIQKSLFECGKRRWVSHMTMFWGFVGAAATSTLLYLFHNDGIALPLADPIKILGNLSAVLLLLGLLLSVEKRLRDSFERSNTIFFDSFFLLLFAGAALTGVATELARLMGAQLAYSLYVTHLGFAALLLGLAPWSKFAHAVYRPIVHVIDTVIPSYVGDKGIMREAIHYLVKGENLHE
jgi:quinone-modifying oxidoreductase subunit QmoC